MNSQERGFADLHERLLKLETQNRRLKRLGAAALIVVALLVTMGQAPSKKTVEANEFILRDSSGKLRASLLVDETTKTSTAQLLLFGPDGSETVRIDSGFPRVGGGAVTLSGENRQTAILSSNLFSMTSVDHAGMMLGRDALYLNDDQGFEAALGVIALVTPKTGETHKTSAASVVLFDKDRNVIWRAP